MSEQEQGQQFEQRSSIKVTRNAKGDAQFEVKVYDDYDIDALIATREEAVAQYRALEREFYGPPLGSAEAAA